jgi:hypothetical protein
VLAPRLARVAAVLDDDIYPVSWTGQQAIVTLPEHIDASNVGRSARNSCL